MMKFIWVNLLGGLISFAAMAQAVDTIYNGESAEPVTLDKILENVRPGMVVVLGEQHGTTAQPEFQLQVLENIRKKGLMVSLGMEFFEYPMQELVDQYRQGLLLEADFLKQVGWGQGFPYSSYRQQVLFPDLKESFVVALNAPRSLTGKISKKGMGSLTSEEQQLLPPQFQIGNSAYFERFKDAMGNHLPDPSALNNYFTAQSVWDDTMAWKAKEFLTAHPDQVLVIIVGEFHVQYGGGLPDRLMARGLTDLLTFSLINSHGLTADELDAEIRPGKYGPRAHGIWVRDY